MQAEINGEKIDTALTLFFHRLIISYLLQDLPNPDKE